MAYAKFNRAWHLFFVDGRQIYDLTNDDPLREDYGQAQASQKAREVDKNSRTRQPIAVVDFDQNYEPISASFLANASKAVSRNTLWGLLK
ncbi:MAG: hypothetical protein NT086_15985 [Proteobacteria bacterium]|nr:hypothetical protein [Pseudomonadota bacterium]